MLARINSYSQILGFAGLPNPAEFKNERTTNENVSIYYN